MKRVFGTFEVIFDLLYLVFAIIISFLLLGSSQSNPAMTLSGIMSLVLVVGDAFHLVPRIIVIKTGKENDMRKLLGRGKQITSISMTVFYLLLWQIGNTIFQSNTFSDWSYFLYFLASVRISLCLLPQNKWTDRYPPVGWGIARNIPFLLMGAFVVVMFYQNRSIYDGFGWAWLALSLSFAFYLPVVLWANKYPKIGMLMLPKTCAYLWLLVMCLSL